MDEYHRATARMLRACGARLVVSDGRIRLLLGSAIADARPELGLRAAADLLDRGRSELEVDADPSTLGLIQFSSGSTVDPKPVALTHQNLISQSAAFHALITQLPGTRELGVSWLPLYHDMGLIGALLSAVYYPGPLVLLPPEAFLARPALWLRTISRFRATISGAPNFAYSLCLKRVRDDELEGADLSSWTYAMNGAEPVSAEVMRGLQPRKWFLISGSLSPIAGSAAASASSRPSAAPRCWLMSASTARTGAPLAAR
jgi:acyl-CoA synthetase (AMP-forming)/AMP-acid ligase II